eukprot:gnl/TRDRNA2_/TRDRNA2_187458_c0_seq1.p1 gnl/TRDRNA2_/TRDRNA2_187458_c0~~gnl/TRDRNA2_/TRDRNA2_187458_c0_seq1.p1  ORF type:complete len:629 (+),score=115.72 gnl/TRDRNA2_/TRDRNA2_187458_c0_seq1:88-1887(+)
MEIGGLTLDGAPSSGPGPRKVEPASDSPHDQLVALFEEDFEFQMHDNPEFASQAGFHQYDSRLQDLSPAAFELRVEHNAETQARLAKIDLSALSASDRLYADLFAAAIAGETRCLELGCHCLPINSIGCSGVHENFLEVVEWMRFETEDDFKIYLNRLMAFADQVDGYCNLLAYGCGMRGMSASKSMLRRIPDRLKELVSGEADAILLAPLEGKELNPELVEQIKQGIAHCFKGSCQKLYDFITDFYESSGRADPGCSALRNGKEVYAECLCYHTTTSKSADEIHALGLSEVARIEGRFQKEVLDALGFKGSFTEFAESLKQDKSFFYESEDELLEGYRALVTRIREMLPKYFKKLPEMPLEVVGKRSGPAAYYYAGVVGQRPGRFYVNCTRINERPKYEMPALALHEGIPGHHLQGALALETPELPRFLRFIEDRRYEYAPARRPLYTGYLEGWALYCEALGEEMGMYTTPQELFGRLSMEMMRAVRLVVDTGIHAFGWSVEKAAAYMEEKTGMAAAECSNECHRYAAWPGQACAYKVGQLAIEDLRRRAEEALGPEQFELPAFHEICVGSGPVPLDILGQRVDAWITERKAASASAM